ncbi:LacI family DNA-binding transcriptional regulator [Streptomyces acidicola]|uniref:LacI family DNA-binding transcriptional regulator n=1 Tax=Streptomyces acidicola TaxID=2596892 RepID=UPI0037F84CD4
MTTEGSRPRLRDIADLVGISEAAASFALNGKPGVSEATRRRVLDVAKELNWSPHHAARALTGAGSSTVGLVIARSARDVGTELFFHRLMTGMQVVLSRRHYALLFQVVGSVDEEIETYRRWQHERRVDGVVLVDLRRHDRRPAAVAALGLPALIAGGPDPGGALPSVSIDDSAAMKAIMRHLKETGHERVAYVSGTASMLHVHLRVESFEKAGRDLGFSDCRTLSTDFSAAAGETVTESVLRGNPRPTALIYDNEVLAVAGVDVIRRHALHVPGDVAIVVWEDTPVCTALRPALTALRRDAVGFGADVAERLLTLLAGEPATDHEERVPSLIARASTLGDASILGDAGA